MELTPRNGEDRYRWVVLALGTGAQTAFSAVYLGVAVLAPELQDHFGLSLAATGILIASVNAGSLLTLLAWGLLVDRVGERAVTAGGLTGSAAALVAAAHAPGIVWLVVLLVLAGACGSCVNSATGRAVAGWFDARERGLALGLRQTGVPVGGALSALSLPPIAAAAGIDAAFETLAAVCLVAAAACAIGLREPRPGQEAAASPGPAGSPLRDAQIWLLSTGGALLACAQSCIVGFTVLFLHSEHGLSTARAGAALAAIQLLGTTGRVVLGRVSDRSRDRLGPLLAVAVALTVALGATAALARAPVGVVAPLLIVAGGLAMSWNALAFTATVEIAGRLRSGAALGLQQSLIGGVNTFVPLAFAPLVAGTSWQLGFAVVALCPLAALPVLRTLARAPRPSET